MARIPELRTLARPLPQRTTRTSDQRPTWTPLRGWRRTLLGPPAGGQYHPHRGCRRLQPLHVAPSRSPHSARRPPSLPAHLSALRRCSRMESQRKLRSSSFPLLSRLLFRFSTGAPLRSHSSPSSPRRAMGDFRVRHSPQCLHRLPRPRFHQLALSRLRSAYRASCARPPGLRRRTSPPRLRAPSRPPLSGWAPVLSGLVATRDLGGQQLVENRRTNR